MIAIRERIIAAIVARVGGARGLENYDASDLDAGAVTVVVEGEDAAGAGNYDATHLVLPLAIARGKKATGIKSDAWYTEANAELAALITEIYTGGDSADDLIDGIDYQGGGVAMLTDGARGFTCQGNFNIRYAHLHGDPYHNGKEVI